MVQVSLSSFRCQSNKYQDTQSIQWLKVNCLFAGALQPGIVESYPLNRGHKVVLQKLAEILAYLKKNQRNSQHSLFCAKFYEEFNGASCQIFSRVQKKIMSKNVEGVFCTKFNILRVAFKCWRTITDDNSFEQCINLARNLREN